MKFLPEGVNPALLKEFENIGEVETAVKAGEIFEGRVTVCDTARNLHIRLGKIHGVIPYKEGALGISDGSVRDIALISKVNKIVCFKVTGIGDFGGEAVALLSRRLVQQECMDNYISHLSVGDVIDAKVTHLEKFGAFIDIGAGINSLIPIDMLSVSRISHASQRLFEGELIRTVLKNKFDGKLTLRSRSFSAHGAKMRRCSPSAKRLRVLCAVLNHTAFLSNLCRIWQGLPSRATIWCRGSAFRSI